MKPSFQTHALEVSPYQHIHPISLSILKDHDNRLMGYLKYDRTSYGIESLGVYCCVRFEKPHGHWRMFLTQSSTEDMLGFSGFIEEMNYVVFEELHLDFDECAQTLREFERRHVFFDGVDIKVNGTKMSSIDGSRERKKVNPRSLISKVLSRTIFFSV
jgi:hypothetical protein